MAKRLLSFKPKAFTAVGLAILICHSGLAQDAETQERINRLEDAVQQLLRQNAELQEQIDQLQGDGAAEEESATATAEMAGAPPAEPASLYGDKDLRMYWSNGLKFESGDGESFKGTFGGRIQLDAAAYSPDDDLEALTGDTFGPGAEFRRVRLHTTGEFAASTPAFYKLEVDFAGSEVALKDVYVGLNDIPVVGKIQAGHFKEPFGLEELTSSRFITLMERSPVTEAFVPSRNYGIAVGNTALENRMTWAAGVFTDTEGTGRMVQNLKGNVRGTARITGLPFYQDDGRKLLHLGVSGSIINPLDNSVRFRARPGSHLAPRFADTGTGAIASDMAYLVGAEAAYVQGPFSAQAEYVHTGASRDAPGASDLDFSGFYLLGSWFITGENRVYKTSSGTFDRVKPKNNFSLSEGGLGAWELSLRYSHLDLDDADIDGGKINEYAAGLGWYLNPNTRAMFNYGYAEADYRATEGNSHIFQGRVQVDF